MIGCSAKMILPPKPKQTKTRKTWKKVLNKDKKNSSAQIQQLTPTKLSVCAVHSTQGLICVCLQATVSNGHAGWLQTLNDAELAGTQQNAPWHCYHVVVLITIFIDITDKLHVNIQGSAQPRKRTHTVPILDRACPDGSSPHIGETDHDLPKF